jgi:hypothetical protein
MLSAKRKHLFISPLNTILPILTKKTFPCQVERSRDLTKSFYCAAFTNFCSKVPCAERTCRI